MAPANHSAVLLYFHFSLLDTFLVKVVQNQVDRLNLGEEMFYKELFYISGEFVDIVSWQMGGTFELLLTALKQVLNAVAERCRFHYWVLCSLCFYCQCHLFMSLICIRVWVSVLCMSHRGNSVVEPLMTKSGGCLLPCGHCMLPFVAGIAWFIYFPLKWKLCSTAGRSWPRSGDGSWVQD